MGKWMVCKWEFYSLWLLWGKGGVFLFVLKG